MSNKTNKDIPQFSNEAEEREFWEREDSSERVDWTKAERITFSNLKPSTRSISLRLPAELLDAIRVAANRRDVPYQSLMKVWLAEKTREEKQGHHSA
jgi:predicted DNA binding CopG/RHH family protein